LGGFTISDVEVVTNTTGLTRLQNMYMHNWGEIMAHGYSDYWKAEIEKMGGRTSSQFKLSEKDKAKIKDIFSFSFSVISPRGSTLPADSDIARNKVIKMLNADGWKTPARFMDTFTVPCSEGQLTISSAYAELLR